MSTLKHVPLSPCRPCTPGEQIYVDLWNEFATTRPREWRAIFADNAPCRQRCASVATSFIKFMGCPVGRAFTQEAIDEVRSTTVGKFRGGCAADTYIAVWAIYNRRIPWRNSGLRLSEFMLARKYPLVNNHVDWDLVPCVTQEDNDTLESMVVWWSTPMAELMRAVASPLIEAAVAKERWCTFPSTLE